MIIFVICLNSPNENVQIRNVYLSIIVNVLIFIFSYEINLFVFFFQFILYLISLILIGLLDFEKNPMRLKDAFFFVIIFICAFYLLRENSINLRNSFMNNLKIKEDNDYYFDLVNNLNGMMISIDNNTISYYNNNFKEFVLDKNFNSKKLSKINKKKLSENKNLENLNSLSKNFRSKENTWKKYHHSNIIKKPFNRSKKERVNKFHLDQFDLEDQIKNNNYSNSSINLNNSYLKLNYDKNHTFSNKQIMKNDLFEKQIDLSFKNETKVDNRINHNNKKLDSFNKTNSKNNEVCFKDFSNLLVNIEGIKYKNYIDSFKVNKLSDIFSYLNDKNLLQILNKINEKPLKTFTTKKFVLLGSFYNETGSKFFQIYFRSDQKTNNIDLFIDDISKIKEEEQIESEKNSKIFAKNVHEFKTPLNSIIGMIKSLNMDILDSTVTINNFNQNDKFKIVLNQIENLSNYVLFLINDIIDFSKISSNYNEKIINNQIFNFKIVKIDLREITNFCSEITKSLILNKGRENFVKVDNDFDYRICMFDIFSDEFRLKQILLNILSNSVKFTRSGFIEIKTKLIITEEKDSELDCKNNFHNNNILNNSLLKEANIDNKKYIYKIKISIIDSGIGFYEKDLESLLKFKDYKMLESGKSLNKEGSGLGLSITNQIIKELKHEMTVESEKGKGSCFSVLINVDKPKADYKLILDKEKNSLYSIDENISNLTIIKSNKDKDSIIKNKMENSFESSYLLENIISQKSVREFRNKNLIIEDVDVFNLNKGYFLNLDFNSNKNCNKYLKNDYHGFRNFKTYHHSTERYSNKRDKNFNKFLLIERKNNKKYPNTDSFINNSVLLSSTIILEENDINNYLKDVKLINGNLFNSKINSNKRINIYNYLLRDSSIKSPNNSKLIEIQKSKSGGTESISLSKSSLKKSSNKDLERLTSNKTLVKSKTKDNRNIILIVDDNKDIRNSLKNIVDKVLKKLKMDILYITKEGEDGSFIIRNIIKDQFKGNKIKCVITDENMEFINGSTAINLLKDLEKKGLIYSITYVSNTSCDDMNTFGYLKKCGIEYFLPKFCNMEKIENFFQETNLFNK